MLKINGTEEAYEPMSISELIARHNFDGRTVAVELNGEIIDRAAWDGRRVADGDVLEIISFMGGG